MAVRQADRDVSDEARGRLRMSYSMMNPPPGGWRSPTDEEMSGVGGAVLTFGGAAFGILGLGGLAVVMGPFIAAFLLAHPGIPASAVWAVAKAMVKGDDAVKAGLAAGTDAAGVAVIREFLGDLPGVRLPRTR
jgi:hypothetical protein